VIDVFLGISNTDLYLLSHTSVDQLCLNCPNIGIVEIVIVTGVH
jgi:hypothetical protein